MATEIVMPQMGAEMEEGTLLKWLKQPGDVVNRGDIVAEIETDKATVELDSFEAGTFLKAVVEEGTTVPVGQVIAYLGAAGEQAPDGPGAPQPAARSEAAPTAPVSGTSNGSAGPASVAEAGAGTDARATDAERATMTAEMATETMHAERTANAADTVDPARPAGESAPPPTSSAPPEPVQSGTRDSLRRDGVRLRVSPVARSMAEEMGVDLSLIRGSGPEGRITRRDVEDFARNRAALQVHGDEGRAPAATEPPRAPRPAAPQVQAIPAPPVQPPPAQPAPAAGATMQDPRSAPSAASPDADDAVEPLTRMRQAIARRMATAKREIPHYYVALPVDMTDALAMRRDLNAQLEEGDRISVNDLILKACALALEHHPRFNATFTEQAITIHHQINIGIAVALEDGLVVPAVLDCRGKSLGALARSSRDVAERARGGRLRPAELNDGTFTVSNLGMYGVETLIAIIQPGQAAILGVGRSEDRPVVRDGQIVVRQMMTIALSADHRVTDGAMGAQFAAEIKTLLEHPARLVL